MTVTMSTASPASEGTFLATSFWLADALHGIGRTDEATELFERLLSLRNDVGLLSEEYDPKTGRHLGNTPQAFSHASLITTALTLSATGASSLSRISELSRLTSSSRPAVGLEEAQPDLVDGRVGGYGVPEPVERHLADDRDGRGLEQLADVRPDEGDAEDDLALLVDDHPGRSLVAVGADARAGDLADLVVDDADVVAGRGRRPAAVRPTDATSGSVNVTCGTASWSAVATCVPHGASATGAPFARAAMTSPAARAWYLPWCVSSARCVDVARGVQPVEAAHEQGVVGLQPGAGLEPDRVQADVSGARRTAGRDQHLLGRDGRTVAESRRRPFRRPRVTRVVSVSSST